MNRLLSKLALLEKIGDFFALFLETVYSFESRKRGDSKESVRERDKNRQKKNDFNKQMEFRKKSSRLFVFLIRVYQWTLSPFLGKCCRFYPSCSEYCAQAINKYGVWKGGWMGLKRVIKCGPWHKGGIDEI